MIIGKDGKIKGFNKYFWNFTGSDRPLGRSIYKIDFFKREKLTRNYRELFRKGKAFSRFNCKTKNREGEIKFLNIVAVPLKNRRNRIEGAVSTAVDNTEAIEARNNLRRITKELDEKIRRKTGILKRINRRLTNILNLKAKFVADASHELRTPLTVIRGNVDLAKMQDAPDKKQLLQLFEIIVEEVERMRDVLDDLTMLTNAGTNREEINSEKTDINEIMRSVERALKIIADKKNISFKRVGGTSQEVIINGDKIKLKKLFSNIVQNAIKYTEAGGRVETKLEKINGKAQITVKDTGVGMPREDIPHIFERFYRVAKEGRRHEEGSGLGLSIAKLIAESHGGKIEVKSELGKGSVFTIILPLDVKRKNRIRWIR